DAGELTVQGGAISRHGVCRVRLEPCDEVRGEGLVGSVVCAVGIRGKEPIVIDGLWRETGEIRADVLLAGVVRRARRGAGSGANVLGVRGIRCVLEVTLRDVSASCRVDVAMKRCETGWIAGGQVGNDNARNHQD